MFLCMGAVHLPCSTKGQDTDRHTGLSTSELQVAILELGRELITPPPCGNPAPLFPSAWDWTGVRGEKEKEEPTLELPLGLSDS